MRTLILSLVILFSSIPAFAGVACPNTALSDLRMVSTNPDQGTALIRNMVTGQDWQISVGDFIGFDQAEVIAIKEYKIILRLGDMTTSLNQIPMWQEVPGNRVEFGN